MSSSHLESTFVPIALVLLLCSALAAADEKKASRYPAAPRADVVDTYHGVKVADPFRPLEDVDAPATRAWIEAENAITEKWLSEVPSREPLRRRLTQLWDFERFSAPFQEGGHYFFLKNSGLQNQAVLYHIDSLGAQPRVLLDPNRLSSDGTVALAGTSVSRDGKRLAYAVAVAGSDWNEWRVKDVRTGLDTSDHLTWVKFSGVSWTKDGKGFYYSRYEPPAKGKELEAVNKNQKLCFHKLDRPQSEDALVYARPDDPELGFSGEVTDDGRFLVITVWKGTDRRNRLYYKDLTNPKGEVVRLFDDFDAHYGFVGNDGTTFFVRTDLGAPRGRLVSVDVAGDPAKRVLKTLIPASEEVLEAVSLVADRFVVDVMKDASSRARIHTLDGKLEKEIELPGIGSAGGFGGRRSDRETFFTFTSFTTPATVYRYDFDKGRTEVFKKPRLHFDPSAFEVEQVFYESKDKTRIPMFLVRKKGTPRDGQAPVYLYGYGGFNVPMTPYFSVKTLVLVERGGVYAQPCLRGGSEYGEEWHRAGMLDKKQNVFDDFAAAAEWLVTSKTTSAKRLGIGGGSNGGLLVGAVLNQHPELFGAAVPAVGVMDMLRFHKFTIGWGWVSDYGSSDDPAQFKWLSAYSPLQNVRKGTNYPAVLVVTADHDDRVVPGHSFKYAAAMQEAQAGEAPILIRIETKAGHGAGKPTSKQIEEAADVLAFLDRALGGFAPLPPEAPEPER
jgi:prolyl oligopeptidase